MIGYAIVIILSVSNLILGFLAYRRNLSNKVNRYFALITLFVTIWMISTFLEKEFSGPGIVFTMVKIDFASALTLSFFFFLFCLNFPQSKTQRTTLWKTTLIVVFSALTFVASFTGLLIDHIEILPTRINTVGGFLYYPYLFLLILFIIGGIFIFLRKYASLQGAQKLQARYVLTGLSLSAIIALITNVGLDIFFSDVPTSVVRFGIYGISSFVGLSAYAIVKHRLLDIVVIIRKVTILGILLMIILGIFSLVAFGLPFVFAESLPEDTFQITLVAVAFIVALFFQPLRRAIEEFTDKWFFKGAYKPQEVIDALSEKISSVIDLRVLLDSTAQILLQAFRSEHAVFSVKEKIGEDRRTMQNFSQNDAESKDLKFIAYNTEGRHRPMEEYAYNEKHAFTKYFNKYPSEVIIRDELQREVGELGSTKHGSRNMKHEARIMKHESGSMNHGIGKREAVDIHLKQMVLKEMENHDFAIIFPVLSKDELVGIFGLGVKKSGDIYTTQDLNILELYAHQVGVAVENTKLYADLKLFNEKLQLEVEKATQDLRVTNAQLTFRNKDLGALQKITNLITQTLDLAQITQTIADSIQTELGYIGGIIYFYDKEKKVLRPSAITKTPLTQMAIRLLPKSPFEYEINDADNNLNTDAFKSASMKMSNKFSDFVHPPLPGILIDEMQKLLGMKTVVAVPIFVENEAIGLINFGLNKNQGEVTDQELQMMRSLADQMGIVVRNVRLYDAVKSYSSKLEEANAYLKELDQTKSEFISIASHQLRSPMTGIKGYLSMLIDGDFGALDEKKKGIIKQMFENTERLIRLINIFLNVSRIEAGRLHLDKRETQISEVIKSVITEMSNQAKSKKLELYFEEPKEKIPPFIADFDKLRDVVLNFVDNAIKYTASGKVWVTVGTEKRPKALINSADLSASQRPSAEDGVVVRVNDTGMGLDPEDAKKLFDKFSRVKGIAQINPDGSGLGLYIAKKLSEAHNGGVWVESKGKGKGSSFCLWVPAYAKASAGEPASPEL